MERLAMSSAAVVAAETRHWAKIEEVATDFAIKKWIKKFKHKNKTNKLVNNQLVIPGYQVDEPVE